MVPELGGQRFMPFPLDVGLGDADPGSPDVLRGGIDLSFADLAPLDVPAVSVAVHVAEKLHALSVPRTDGRENSRVKDLVDVVLLRQVAFADVESVRRAVAATFERRRTHELPARVEVPVRAWAREFRKFATDLQLDAGANTVELGADILNDLVNAIRRLGGPLRRCARASLLDRGFTVSARTRRSSSPTPVADHDGRGGGAGTGRPRRLADRPTRAREVTA